jgi:hypothetical protein
MRGLPSSKAMATLFGLFSNWKLDSIEHVESAYTPAIISCMTELFLLSISCVILNSCYDRFLSEAWKKLIKTPMQECIIMTCSGAVNFIVWEETG